MKRFVLAALLGALAETSPQAAPVDTGRVDLVEVAAGDMDGRLLSDLGHRVLAAKEYKWKHGQTQHFVIHFENGIFAAKVGRMAEAFHDYIAADLQGATDRIEGRSHIFIFRNAADWKVFIQRYHQGGMEWSASMVVGPIMFLQQMGDASSSAEVLGHEMSHLVMNRFVEGGLPLWLNEGTAEWYGEFAYAAYKGVKKSKRAQFLGLRSTFPVPDLLAATAYPADTKKVHEFYSTAKHVVAFLQLEMPPDRFLPFLQDLAKGGEVEAALRDRYGVAGVAEFGERFEKFRR